MSQRNFQEKVRATLGKKIDVREEEEDERRKNEHMCVDVKLGHRAERGKHEEEQSMPSGGRNTEQGTQLKPECKTS